MLIKKLLVIAAVATAALIALPETSEARRGGGFRAGGGIRVAAVRTRVIRVRPRVVYRAPLVIATGGGCGWLRQRAVRTGSPYWWRRYDLCRRGY